ncbi:PD-(D/E)XK nuclease family protein [Thiohalorhabdus sp.]|uniref:PD-(D/E)XK nuclease family protein n=1 Tax=Thiohalorhabdus sp. TaxID=3094134 RepID=UPI002FC3B9D9
MEAWLDTLEGGPTVATVTNRLARSIRRAYHQRQSAAGKWAWPSPDVLPFSAWLRRAWSDARDFGAATGTLLTAAQELALWEQVIEADIADGQTPGLLRVSGTAPEAREAWRLAREWHLDAAESDMDRTEVAGGADTAAFRRWRQTFERHLAQGSWVAPAQLPERLTALFREGALTAPDHLHLAGFDDIPPQHQAMLDALTDRGTEVVTTNPQTTPGNARLAAYSDQAAEVRAAAAWARSQLEAGAEGPVAIVAPELGEVRDALERALLDTFHDPTSRPERSPADLPFNLSLGQPLAEVPVVSDALQALSLAVAGLPVAEAGALVRSPHLAGAAAEAAPRVQLDLTLRERGGDRVHRSEVARLAARTEGDGRPADHGCQELAQGLQSVRRLLDDAPRRQLPSAWAETLAGCLEALGWARERPLDSVEHQAMEAWQDNALEAMVALDPVLGAVDAAAAIRRLRRLAGDTVFQPRSDPEAPVQVLGLLEAAGHRFERLWLLGAHEAAWPQPPRPNPFLPRRLQKRLRLPRATPERELAFAERATERLLAAAPEVVVSYPLRGPRDEDFPPSPLVAHLPRAEPGEPVLPARAWEEQLVAEAPLERLGDTRGPGLAGDNPVPGGAALFKHQSDCPFRAFASHRLAAEMPEAPAYRPDPLEHGQLLHAALREVWHYLGDQATLQATPDEEQTALCHRVADAQVATARRQRPGLYGERAAALEAERLAERLDAWLSKERNRRLTFRAADLEAATEATVGGVRVRLRVDRVDELADGRRLVIDYKTGEADYKLWLGERPEEPQLPLYALAVGEAVAGIAYARLKPDLLDIEGIADEGIAEGPSGRGLRAASQVKQLDGAGWAEVVDHWRGVLEGLAGDIAAGEAAVTPRAPPGAGRSPCRLCHLHALCRIYEKASIPRNDDDG